MYSRYLHGIREVDRDIVDETFVNLSTCTAVGVGAELRRTLPRISLTIRVVPKVLQNKILFGRK